MTTVVIILLNLTLKLRCSAIYSGNMFLATFIKFVKDTYTDAFRLTCHPRTSIQSLYRVSLYRNAIFLMTNTGIIAILGIVFWALVARFYSTEELGLGSALISAGMLLSFFGTMGLGFGIIRYLPYYNDKTQLLNSSFIISILATIVVTCIFLVGLPIWSPDLVFVRESPLYFTAFVIFSTAATLFNVLARAFIGFRRAGFTLTSGIISSVVKLILVIVFAAFFEAFSIFASWGISMVISVLICLFFFLPQALPGFRLYLVRFSKPNKLDKEILRFSFANYGGQALQMAATWTLPLIVLNLLDPEANAHFYMAWTMANILLSISTMISMSLFAEGSNIGGKFGEDLRKSIKLIVLITIPAVIFVLLLGDKILLLFGREYAENGTHLLWLLTISVLPASITYLYLGIAQVEKKLKTVVVINGVLAFGILTISSLLLPWIGIIGVGVGYLATQSALALVCISLLVKMLKVLPPVTIDNDQHPHPTV